MEKILKYAVLSYSPFALPGENVDLGILFCKEKQDYREFRFRKDLSELAKFGDMVDIAMVEKLLYGIKEEVESEKYEHKVFDIDEYTRFFINDFCFGETKMMKYDDWDRGVERIVEMVWGRDERI